MTRREALQRTAVLLGLALSPSGIRTALAQIASEPAGAPRVRHLTAARYATAAAIAEALLPRTDTPGAIDVGAPEFIDTCYGRFMTAAQKTQLDSLLDHATANGFAAADLATQQQRLRDYGTSSAAADPAPRAGIRFFRELAMLGYFSSEQVCQAVLVYDPVPGRFEADIALAETNGRAWAE